MGKLATNSRQKLIRQVLPPQRPTNGIGIMLVAATAMFFAVASSAFLLQARLAAPSHHPTPCYAAPVPTVMPSAVPAPVAKPAPVCDKVKYRVMSSGQTVVTYACPPELVYEWPNVPAAASIPAEFAP